MVANMHPILFTFPDWLPLIGGKSIHIYGLMIATGFLVGLQWAKYEAKRLSLDVKLIMDIFFYGIIAGLVGARILYIINSVDDFWSDPLVLFRVWEGGLVFQGGVIATIIVIIWLCRRYKLPFFETADVFAPALAIGHAFGRIGCFFAGCCYGKACDVNFPLGVVFPDRPDGIAPSGIPLYPVQLFESFGEILIFLFLVFYRKKKQFDGEVTLFYLMMYSILRSFNELFRGDHVRGYVLEPFVSIGQFISLVTIIICIFLWVYLKKNAIKR